MNRKEKKKKNGKEIITKRETNKASAARLDTFKRKKQRRKGGV